MLIIIRSTTARIMYRKAKFVTQVNEKPKKPQKKHPDPKGDGENESTCDTLACQSPSQGKICNFYSKPNQSLSKLSIRQIFLVFSRVHYDFSLRHRTLFLALEIYFNYKRALNSPEESIPEPHLLLVSMNLAMKYEQIYPPSMVSLFKPLKLCISMQIYRKEQCEVLMKLDADLNMKTAPDLLEEILKNQEKNIYFHAFYLLELAHTKQEIAETYSTEQICWAIILAMMPLHLRLDQYQIKGLNIDTVEQCSKLIVKARYQTSKVIQQKYTNAKYGYVAECSLPNSVKLEE